MKRIALNIALLLALLLSIGFNWSIKENRSRKNLLYVPEMYTAVSAEPYAKSDILPHGRVLTDPVPGTTARGYMPDGYEATVESAALAGLELVSPVDGSDLAALDRGQVIYRRFCLPCHGPTGAGDGLVAQKGFPPPPAFTAESSLNMSDGEMYHVLTYGKGNMPAYATQITRIDRWNVISYVRQMQADASQKSEATR